VGGRNVKAPPELGTLMPGNFSSDGGESGPESGRLKMTTLPSPMYCTIIPLWAQVSIDLFKIKSSIFKDTFLTYNVTLYYITLVFL
jgi:hypothetical protein